MPVQLCYLEVNPTPWYQSPPGQKVLGAAEVMEKVRDAVFGCAGQPGRCPREKYSGKAGSRNRGRSVRSLAELRWVLVRASQARTRREMEPRPILGNSCHSGLRTVCLCWASPETSCRPVVRASCWLVAATR